MLLPVLLLAVGLAAPFVLRAAARSASRPWLVVVGEVAGLLLAWLGLLGSVSAIVAPKVGVLELCRLVAMQPLTAVGPVSTPVLLFVVVLMPGRAVGSALASTRAGHVLRRQIEVSGGAHRSPAEAPLGTVACTVGVLRPRVVVDPLLLGRLTVPQQSAVLSHERTHARGLHGLIDVAVRALAAGLAPWPGARVAFADVRRHLEAIADDGAARSSGRRVVAAAIVAAACGPSPLPAGGLGAAGFTVWRVDRLLDAPLPRRSWDVPVTLGLVAVAVLVMGQLSVHGLHALSNWHAIPVLTTCCVV